MTLTLIKGKKYLLPFKVMRYHTFLMIDPKYSPFKTIVKNIMSYIDIVETYCRLEGLAKEKRKLKKERRNWLQIQTREELIRRYYDRILQLEGLGFVRTKADNRFNY